MPRLKYLITSCVLALTVSLGLSVAAPAYAVTLVGTTTDASGINGVVIDSVTYNVTFVNGSYNSVYTSLPTFLGNNSGATDATTALISALNGLGVTNLDGLPPPTYYANLVAAVPEQYPVEGLVASATAACPTEPIVCAASSWGTEGALFTLPAATSTTIDYAVFTVANTPLPAALPLFASGLGALGLLGWRRKRKNAAAIAA